MAEEYGLPLWHAYGRMIRGWARVAGAIEPGIDELRRGLDDEQTEATVWRPYYVGLLAQALATIGRIDEARDITAALATVEATGERWCLAEPQRIGGELIRQAAGHQTNVLVAQTSAAAATKPRSASSARSPPLARSTRDPGSCGEQASTTSTTGRTSAQGGEIVEEALVVHRGPRHR
jgi:hypothetical protein